MRDNLSRAGRKAEILKAIVRRHEEGNTEGLTVYGVAKLCDLKRSTYIQGLLIELVADGFLNVTVQHHRPNRDKRVFSLSEKVTGMPATQKAQMFGGRVVKVKGFRYSEQLALV